MIRNILYNRYCFKCKSTSNQKLIDIIKIDPIFNKYYATYNCDYCNQTNHYDVSYKRILTLCEIKERHKY